MGEGSRSIDPDGLTKRGRTVIETARWVADLHRVSGAVLLLNNGDYTTVPGILDAPTLRLLAELETVAWADTPRITNIGNHDLSSSRETGLHNLLLHTLFPSAYVPDPGRVLMVPEEEHGPALYVVPFTHSATDQEALLATIPDGALVAVHTPILGTHMTPTAFEENGLPLECFKRFRLTLASHYHLPQVHLNSGLASNPWRPVVDGSFTLSVGPKDRGTVVVLGTPLPHSFSDTGLAYGCWQLAIEDRLWVMRFHENPLAPRYASFTTFSEAGVAQLQKAVESGENLFLSMAAPPEVTDDLRALVSGSNVTLRLVKTKPDIQLDQRIALEEADLLGSIRSYMAHLEWAPADAAPVLEVISQLASSLSPAVQPSSPRILALTLSNFMSWEAARLEFATPAGVVLVLGENEDVTACKSNGAGKSSLFEAMVWALWGVTLRSLPSRDQVVRHGATSTTVELEFEVGEEHYLVRRMRRASGGGKVALFKMAEGEWVEISATTARSIDQQISQAFGQSLQLFCSATYFSRSQPGFTELGDSGRKDLLAQILGLSAYDDLRRAVRDAQLVSSHDVERSGWKLDIQGEAAERTKERWQQAKGEATERKIAIAAELAALEPQYKAAVASEKKSARRRADLDEDLKLKRTTLQRFEQALATREQDLAHAEEIAEGYTSAVSDQERGVRSAEKVVKREQDALQAIKMTCPTCNQKLPVAAREAARTNQLKRIEEAQVSLREVKKRLLSTRSSQQSSQELCQKHTADIEGLKSSLGNARNAVTRLEKQLEQLDPGDSSAELATRLAELRAEDPFVAARQAKEAWTQEQALLRGMLQAYEELKAKGHTLYKANEVLGPRALISYLLDSALGAINGTLDGLSQSLFGGDFDVHLESVTELASGEEANRIAVRCTTAGDSYGSASSGEQQKADLAILIALSSLARLRGLSTNILVADEVFYALDNEAVRYAMDALVRFAAEEQRLVFLVSHSEYAAAFSPEVLKVRRINGTSSIEAFPPCLQQAVAARTTPSRGGTSTEKPASRRSRRSEKSHAIAN